MIQPGSSSKPKYSEQSHGFELTGYLLWGVFPEEKERGKSVFICSVCSPLEGNDLSRCMAAILQPRLCDD